MTLVRSTSGASLFGLRVQLFLPCRQYGYRGSKAWDCSWPLVLLQLRLETFDELQESRPRFRRWPQQAEILLTPPLSSRSRRDTAMARLGAAANCGCYDCAAHHSTSLEQTPLFNVTTTCRK